MQKLTFIKLLRVEYIPRNPEPGILYVAEEFDAAIHLCACGCGLKVSTPLGPAGWVLSETAGGPSLRPSVGNWQFPCKSHYWIDGGQIVWSLEWTPEQIAAGRQAEESRRQEYYGNLGRKEAGWLQRLWSWFKSLFRWN